MSHGKSDGKLSERRATLDYRAHFAQIWMIYLRENYEVVEDVATAFRVDGSTARKWWAGTHSPSGFAVGLAFSANHQSASKILELK